METWKEYKDSGYFVSDSGLVTGRNKSTLLRFDLNNQGYPRVSIRSNNVTIKNTVHRLVWKTFNGEIPDGFVVDHIDDDKKNCALSNLQLLTQSKNVVKGWFVRRAKSHSWFPKTNKAA